MLFTLAACVAAALVVTQEEVAQGSVHSPSLELLPSGHALMATVNALGELRAHYCVDVACQTVLSNVSALASGASGSPHLRFDATSTPLVAFQREENQVLSLGRCRDSVCSDGLVSAPVDVIRATGVDRIDGGVAMVVDSLGGLHILYRHSFPVSSLRLAYASIHSLSIHSFIHSFILR